MRSPTSPSGKPSPVALRRRQRRERGPDPRLPYTPRYFPNASCHVGMVMPAAASLAFDRAQ